MTFWGVEVKPGTPVTHSSEKGRRLRISQATLGFGEASKKTVVQCNVGDRWPVLLFSLLPNKRESCRLDLEFEEADDVVFSVIGPQSVHLTGYYVQQNQQSNPHSDTESYGVDIENTRTDGSNHHSDDDDEYEDSFINDDEIKVTSHSPVLSSKGIDDATLQNAKPKERKGRGKQLKKKDRVIESDNNVNSHEYEDEDGSLPVFKTTMSDAVEKIGQATEEMDNEAKDDAVHGSESKQKNDRLNINGKQEGEKMPSLDVEKTQVNEENKEHFDEMENFANIIMSIHRNNTKDISINQNSPVSGGRDQLQFPELAIPEKKRKERSVKKKKKMSKVQTDKEGHSVLREDKELGVEVSTNLEIDENNLATPLELGSLYVQKSKKRRNELQLEGTLAEALDKKCQNSPEENMFEQGLLHVDSMTKDLGAATGEYKDQQRFEDASTEDIGAKSHSIPGEDEVMQESHAEITTEDLAAANGENKEQPTDSIISKKSELLANDNQHDKKIKKTLKKTRGGRGLNVGAIQMTDNSETTATKYEGQILEKFTLSNGLVIEQLAIGPPHGKIASLGKMVKLHYTAMLKESGHVFESAVGKASFKFRLGDENIIDGWNVGIEGMRVGDKRRLIVPPSMGFGDYATENVPPNSWLIYDIELVSVRK
ncbi:hypothetical protein ACS0TY_019580 [Phlomoides rotata]